MQMVSAMHKGSWLVVSSCIQTRIGSVSNECRRANRDALPLEATLHFRRRAENAALYNEGPDTGGLDNDAQNPAITLAGQGAFSATTPPNLNRFGQNSEYK